MHAWTLIPSPLGSLLLAGGPRGLCWCNFLDRKPEAELAELGTRHPGITFEARDEPLHDVAEQLASYFAGRRCTFRVSRDAGGTAFQRRVWEALVQIPCGRTRSYGELAADLGRPRGARAVGSACGENPLAVLVPCHRIVSKDGTLGGYAAGPERKRWLLAHEAALAGPRRG